MPRIATRTSIRLVPDVMFGENILIVTVVISILKLGRKSRSDEAKPSFFSTVIIKQSKALITLA